MPSPAARLRCSLDELPSTTAAHAVSSMCAAPALLPGSEAADGHTVWCVQRKSGHILTHFGLLKLRSPTTCICVVAAAVLLDAVCVGRTQLELDQLRAPTGALVG
jgi:hypothetical protein